MDSGAFFVYLIDLSILVQNIGLHTTTSCRGLVLRARECAFPAEAVPIRSLVTGRLASGGNRIRTLHAGSERDAITPPSRRYKSIK